MVFAFVYDSRNTKPSSFNYGELNRATYVSSKSLSLYQIWQYSLFSKKAASFIRLDQAYRG